jgi:hypothetical protein
MHRAAKILAWVIAFSACFAVGAVIAAHSNPFPPGVVDPGLPVSPTGVATPTPTQAPTLTGTLHLQTVHYLYVGGACRTNWKATLALEVDDKGGVTGTGTIDLAGGLHCDFSVLQVQTKNVIVHVKGTMDGKRVSVALTEAARDPKGSSDFGGLLHNLRFLKLSVVTGQEQQVHAARSDGDRGTYTASGTFTVS